MPRLIPCPTCHSHVLSDERACPHCGATLRSRSARVPAVLVGLALTGCPITAEPVYGVPDSGPDEADTNMDTETDTGETETDTGDAGEPEYGVPDSADAGEPEYGVPESG
jgi:hypothetical protein